MNDKPKESKKIRKGDKVIAIAGNYRGMSGTVLSCKGEGVVVQGLNVRKRHMKSRGQNQPGRIVQIEKAINISNVKVCTEEGKPIKLHMRANKKGERELYYNEGKKEVLHRAIKKSSK